MIRLARWLLGLRPWVLVALVGGWFLKAAAGWALFGFSVVDEPIGGKLKLKRWFGRVTAVEADNDRDGRRDERWEFSWREPFRVGAASDCDQAGERHVLDNDHNGRWDTWERVVGRDDQGRCLTICEGDSDGDGKPDLRFAGDPQGNLPACEQLREKRGF